MRNFPNSEKFQIRSVLSNLNRNLQTLDFPTSSSYLSELNLSMTHVCVFQLISKSKHILKFQLGPHEKYFIIF